MHLTSAHRTPGRSRPIIHFCIPATCSACSCAATTVQGWADAEKKLERVAEIIAVVAVERIGAVVDARVRCSRPMSTHYAAIRVSKVSARKSRSNFTRLRRVLRVAGHGLHGKYGFRCDDGEQ